MSFQNHRSWRKSIRYYTAALRVVREGNANVTNLCSICIILLLSYRYLINKEAANRLKPASMTCISTDKYNVKTSVPCHYDFQAFRLKFQATNYLPSFFLAESRY